MAPKKDQTFQTQGTISKRIYSFHKCSFLYDVSIQSALYLSSYLTEGICEGIGLHYMTASDMQNIYVSLFVQSKIWLEDIKQSRQINGNQWDVK